MYDVVIIGGGPAGANLARMLDKKFKILLVDKRALDKESSTNRKVCCGGLLAPDAQKMFARFGLGIPTDVLAGPQLFSVRTIDFDNDIEMNYQRNYININREKFDRWFVSQVPISVEKKYNTLYRNYNESDNFLEVNLTENEKDIIVQTKILVGADGAISRVRDQGFSNSIKPAKYVSIQKEYATVDDMPYYTSIFDKEITDYYSWIIQKDNTVFIGSAIPENYDANEKFDLLIKKISDYGFKLGKLKTKTGTLIMRPRNSRQLNACKNKVSLVGEAAGFISPSSAEGISYALNSSEILANCINAHGENFPHSYTKKITGIKRNIFVKNLKIIVMYNKFLRLLVMKSGFLSLKKS